MIKFRISQMHLNARDMPFHFKVVHFGDHKARVPKWFGALNASLPFIQGADDFIQDDLPLQQLRVVGARVAAGRACEQQRFLFTA